MGRFSGPAKLLFVVEQPLPAGLQPIDEAFHRTRFRVLPFLGPAFIAAVAYIDPRNFATNIAAGSKYGYTLLWVIVGNHAVAPQFQGSESLLMAVGVLGATVMPHVIYLHSALTQDRIVADTPDTARTLLRYTRVDVIVAMTLAGLINMAMLVMA